ncbi:MAG: DNA repair protein RecN [Ruminococcaceae bacterium]|nr:DNA repair protein RecN [Oscillospiraceae bacterium]
MLQSLHIENVAVIEKADIAFDKGLLVLTGETGAGKSIVIDAINAVLGERITRDVVRAGTDKAFIAAVFTDLPAPVVAALEEQGFAPEEDGSLLVQRSLTADGKGQSRINGRPATVSTLRLIGRMLVNIHGQHENQVLLQPERHVAYLDRLGDLQSVRDAYEQEYQTYCRIRRAIKAATMDEEEKEYKASLLTRQIEEIDAAALQPGEEATLLSRRELARHSGKLAGLLQQVRGAMDGGEGDTLGALALLSDAVAALHTAGTVSDELMELSTRLQSALYDVQACAEEARQAEENLAFDEDALSALEDRLAVIQRTVRKYGVDEADVLKKREDLQGQLEAIHSNDAYLEDLQRQSDIARDATIAASRKLTEARRQAAVRFEEDVCRQLALLDMPHVRLAVSIEPTALTAIGGDKVEFLLSSNPGEPPKSIARTASGGELSRIMLALKSVLADVDDVDTLVFDEVDSGISGRAATRVGAMLRQIAGTRQVLCVTHLAQIAACGHTHLMVSKNVTEGRTFTHVDPLEQPERLQELARIIGGEATDTTLSAAQEMFTRAQV